MTGATMVKLRMTMLETALYNFFSDGNKKPVREVLDFIRANRDDDVVNSTNMAATISVLRGKLPKGRVIHCVTEGRRKYYVMCRTLAKP